MKKNVLRQRIDSCVFDMDQLVVGTLFFTVICFLFPTVTVYYVFFSLVRLLITMTQVRTRAASAATAARFGRDAALIVAVT